MNFKPIAIVRHQKYEEMYYVLYSDGETGDNFYNLSRAKDIVAHYEDYVADMNAEDTIRKTKPHRYRKTLTGKFN